MSVCLKTMNYHNNDGKHANTFRKPYAATSLGRRRDVSCSKAWVILHGDCLLQMCVIQKQKQNNSESSKQTYADTPASRRILIRSTHTRAPTGKIAKDWTCMRMRALTRTHTHTPPHAPSPPTHTQWHWHIHTHTHTRRTLWQARTHADMHTVGAMM